MLAVLARAVTADNTPDHYRAGPGTVGVVDNCLAGLTADSKAEGLTPVSELCRQDAVEYQNHVFRSMARTRQYFFCFDYCLYCPRVSIPYERIYIF